MLTWHDRRMAFSSATPASSPVTAPDDSEVTWSVQQQLEFFRGEEFAGLVFAALGTSLGALSVLAEHYRPGAGVSVVVEATPSGGVPIHLGATTEDLGDAPEHVATLESGGDKVWMWLHPFDPRLPGLATASVPAQVERLWFPGQLVELETLAYRPLRRAVLMATADDGRSAYIKVLHRGAEELRTKHELLEAAGVPVPRLLAPLATPPSADLVATLPATGRSVAQALVDGEDNPVGATELLRVLEAFPPELLSMPRRVPWAERAHEHGQAAGVAFPQHAARIATLSSAIAHRIAAEPAGREVPTHGDLYEANVFVRAGAVTALLDLDSAGPGHRVDDLACFLAHLAVLPQLDDAYANVPAYLTSLVAPFERDAVAQGTTPAALWARTAGVVLSLVAGVADEAHADPERVAWQRIELAASLLDRAR